MKRHFLLVFLPLLLAGGRAFAEPDAAGTIHTSSLKFSLATWKGDKLAAFVMYSDDSMVRSIKSQWTLEQPDVPYDGFYKLGKTYNIPVTFFVIPRLMDDAAAGDVSHVYYSSLEPPSLTAGAGGRWADWKFMHEQGHEIGSHSYSHTDFRPGPDGKPTSSADPHFECGEAVRAITRHIGEKPLSMNFSYGAPTEAVLEVARQYTPLPEEDFSIDTGNVRKAGFGSDTDAAKLIHEMKMALDAGQCLILGGHGIRTELGRREEEAPDFKEKNVRWDGYKPVEYAALEGLFQYLDNNRERIYIDVFKNVSRYLAERKASTIKVLSREEDAVLIEVTHNLDPDVFDLPLTLKIEPQGNVSDISLQQNGKTIPAEKRGPVYLAEVVPNGGPIHVTPIRKAIGNRPSVSCPDWPFMSAG